MSDHCDHGEQFSRLFDLITGFEAAHRHIHKKLDHLLQQGEKIMASLDEVLADVTQESTAIDSLVALVDGIKQQLADALSGTTIPPAVQAKIDAVFSGVDANKAKVVEALAANVPPFPPTP